jgi:hypothetical protein
MDHSLEAVIDGLENEKQKVFYSPCSAEDEHA